MHKDRMSGTRVKSAHQKSTPIAGAPQKKELNMKSTRVARAPGLARKNDPVHKAQSRMGLSVGTRVTSRETRKR